MLHDLHESVPYLYDNTVGDGPYNAWIDPILADEWEMIGWNNVSEMTKFGMPGVFTHGNFDTWSPGYLMFIAALHNGISRLYETFGNGGADTVERTLSPNEYARTGTSRIRRFRKRSGLNGTTTTTRRPAFYVAPLLRRQRQTFRAEFLSQRASARSRRRKTEGPAARCLRPTIAHQGAESESIAKCCRSRAVDTRARCRPSP